ncbi:hypothetical protein Aspvir_006088 [Aspergillus viridinutans]|uniref:Oligopeptide transporter n=1 Tax=Aspergillus viridinutans TaxID=75553 RepID=A0A9P3BSH7_ASPVI|nr:uncharacterized protein Aspvir_006088 [Aspergillus viridinutans]GIK02045.1 hypothetical protein Aspvir_006088 [Aspergillus viridinutans]
MSPSAGDDSEFLHSSRGPHSSQNFTWRALIVGLLVGILINLCNTYYGLQTGAGAQLPTVSALLGYLVINSFAKFNLAPLSKAENVLIVSAATATGCMPGTAGFTEVIPALEYVLGPKEGGPVKMGWMNMVIWSLGLSFFGILFAALLRDRLIFPKVWPWPGATASANVINALHGREKEDFENAVAWDSWPHRETGLLHGAADDGEEDGDVTEPTKLPRNLSLILIPAAWSALFTVFMYFMPITKDLPLFGRQAARKWLWTFSLSPGFFGSGIIMGPEIVLHMLTGAIVGWGILSPYAKGKGWAPGDVGDWETGSRGWLIWISLACLSADTLVKMVWIYFKVIREKYGDWLFRGWENTRLALAGQRGYMPVRNSIIINNNNGPFDDQDSLVDETEHPTTTGTPDGQESPYGGYLLVTIFVVSIPVCIFATQSVFGNKMPWYYTFLSILLALPVAMTGIRGLAESDFNAGSGLAAQLVVATLTPRTKPDSVIINILSGAIAKGGANQAGDLAFDLKIGQLVGAPPDVQTYGQIAGSIFGAIVSCFTYRLFTARFPVPGKFIQIPNSFLQVSTAKMVLNKGLPSGAGAFALGFGIFFVVATVVKMRFQQRWWQVFIPSGVSFAIGIFTTPVFTLSRVLGGLFMWAYLRRAASEQLMLVVVASGMLLGESLGSLGELFLSAVKVPPLGL